MARCNISESETQKQFIDPPLDKVGWYLADRAKVKIEIPVGRYYAEPWNGVTNYYLYRENREILAVVDVRLAETKLIEKDILGLDGFEPCFCAKLRLDIVINEADE